MQAMVVHEWGQPFVREERPDPTPGPLEAVMRVRAAGVGLTLLTMRTGVFGGSVPRVMGHELGGEIVAVGSSVTNVKVGDRCAVYFYLVCGVCRWCRGGRETLCEAFGGYVGVHRDGGFSDYVCLPAMNFIPIPDGLDYESAAVAADAVNTNWHCMRDRAEVRPNDDVLLVGAGGGLGLHGIQVARAFGARVIAVDVSDAKLAAASEWGADEVINARDCDSVADAVRTLTGGRGVQAAIDYVGSSVTFGDCIDSLGMAGRAVAIGSRPGTKVEINPTSLILKETIITGSRHSTRAELIETMDLMASGVVKAAVGRRVPFVDVEELFTDIAEERLIGRGALTYPE